ncbi:hypothetical protein GQ651_13185 [Alphaproteobacteria bacterium GH1-50]|uniref:Oxidoreductase molybdopterin-binding domain-containing protein n=1 Tax=Kangsaoukella pontilimi TaxID=2691042 RepID=A0A7C9ITI2_9RHOB|nr:hypothetical protein [Kangsaoukella pontilimi]MXQ08805.1 hypothetical protein [Kangsaoukella pontilimi]
MRLMTLVLLGGMAVFGGPAIANPMPTPVTLEPIQHADASLTLRSADGQEHRLDMSAIEALPTYRVETTTPWREEAAVFDGVLLSDLLGAYGLDETDSLLVTAENDYTTVFERIVWQSEPILVATRVNGRPISRRERGPILFVLEAGAYASSDVAREQHLVWMAARIEPSE